MRQCKPAMFDPIWALQLLRKRLILCPWSLSRDAVVWRCCVSHSGVARGPKPTFQIFGSFATLS